MASLVLKNTATGVFRLFKRIHDLGGTDHVPLIRLTEKQAAAISGDHTAIPRPTELRDVKVDPQDIRIIRTPNRTPGQRPWIAMIGDEQASYLDDDIVRDLIDLTVPVFEPGQPDWASREIEDIEDKIAEHENQIEVLRKKRAESVFRHNDAVVEKGRKIISQISRMTLVEGDPDIETLGSNRDALVRLVGMCEAHPWLKTTHDPALSQEMNLLAMISVLAPPIEDDIETLEAAHEYLEDIIVQACEMRGIEPRYRANEASTEMEA